MSCEHEFSDSIECAPREIKSRHDPIERFYMVLIRTCNKCGHVEKRKLYSDPYDIAEKFNNICLENDLPYHIVVYEPYEPYESVVNAMLAALETLAGRVDETRT